MSNSNIEVMEQLLKDLAANVGYELIPNPFDTPFEEASIEVLPEYKHFFWPVPTSALNCKEHEDFRKMCIKADIIDTVCTTSFPWPADDKDYVAILLIDVTRRRSGSVKFVDASAWRSLSDETDMAAVCNMLIHDLFPGEDFLAFQMNEDAMDLRLDDKWNEQVRLVSSAEIGDALSPKSYLQNPIAKQGFKYVRLDDIFRIEDLEGAQITKRLEKYFRPHDVELPKDFILHEDNMLELKVPALTVSVNGNLQPQKVVPEDTDFVDLNEKMVLIPHSYVPNMPDIDYLVEQMSNESTIRQLPFFLSPNDRLKEEHLKGVYIEIPEV